MKNHWLERNGAEITTKSFQKYVNVPFCRYRPTSPGTVAALLLSSLSLCAVKTPFVYRWIVPELVSKHSTINRYICHSLLNARTTISHLRGALTSTRLVSTLAMLWTILALLCVRACVCDFLFVVILIFQFSTCLRRTTNKTNTKYRQMNAEWTAIYRLPSLLV